MLFRLIRRFLRWLRRWGKFIFYFGPMFSGKTEDLAFSYWHLKRVLGREAKVFMPAEDTRRSAMEIVSLSGARAPATAVVTPLDILKLVKKGVTDVILDEVHLWQQTTMLDGGETWAILYVIEELLRRGINVYAAGLDTDFLTRPFQPTFDLMAFADGLVRLWARCGACGVPAAFSARFIIDGYGGKRPAGPGDDLIVVAGTEGEEGAGGEIYEPRCGNCHPSLSKG